MPSPGAPFQALGRRLNGGYTKGKSQSFLPLVEV